MNPEAVARFREAGGEAASTPAEAAKGAAVVVAVVVNAAQTEAVLFGPDGAAAAMPEGAVFVSSATMDPAIARRLAARLEETGRHYLDAPMSGGAARAAEGELTFLASGSQAAFAGARDALTAMAGTVYELGDEAGPRRGVQDDQPAAGGGAHRRRLRGDELRGQAGPRPRARLRGDHEVGRQFVDVREPRAAHPRRGLRPKSAVDIFVKDLGIVQDMARAEKYPVPVAAAALQMFLMASGAGMGRDDDASVARLYAQVSGAVLPEK